MPRPESIAAVHAAKYDLRWCSPEEKECKLESYHEALRVAASQFGASVTDLKEAIRKDFGPWMKENNLPKAPVEPE